MVTLSSPLWLLGLAIIPVIRWLHRFRERGPEREVSALFLWRAGAASDTAGRTQQDPDPRWRLRAAVAAAIVLALAEPRLRTEATRPIDVWVDDSISMYALEASETRMRAALRELLRALPRAARGVRLHSLADPASSLDLDRSRGDDSFTALAGWAAQPRGAPLPPPPATLDPDRAHWLITDGADAAVNAWAERAPLSRVIEVGTRADNVAVTRVAARLSLASPDTADVLVSAHNAGPHLETRQLALAAGGEPVGRWSLRLEPGARAAHRIGIPLAAATRLQATLTPADALPNDDTLALALADLQPIRMRLEGRCPSALLAALQAHPRLANAREISERELTIACGPESEAMTPPAILIHAPHTARAAGAPLSAAIELPALDPAWLIGEYAQPVSEGFSEILRGPNGVLIEATATPPRVVHVYLDLANAAFARQPEYPALLDRLVGYALNRETLDAVASAERAPSESRIASLTVPSPRWPGADRVRDSADLSVYAALLAALLLLADIGLLLRERIHARPSRSPAYDSLSKPLRPAAGAHSFANDG
jgi:hypothetical protein